MAIHKWFIKLMKDEPTKKTRRTWLIDENKCLNREEVEKLQHASYRLKNHGLKKQRFSLIRDWFMVELGLNAGLRVDEMANLRRSDLHIEGEKCSLTVLGKGRKLRQVWISRAFKACILDYFQYRKQYGFQSDYLLNNLQDEKISKRSLQKAFKRMLMLAELSDEYSIHCLRHTYATFLLKASQYNYRFVQKQLGHASIRTTQIYASVLETEGRRAVENLYRKENTR